MSNIISTIFLNDDTFPIHAIVKNAIPNPLRGFMWYVERNPENEKVLQELLGVDFKRTQYGYYLEHTKGFIPALEGDHIAISVGINYLSMEQLHTLAEKPTVFKIHKDVFDVPLDKHSLTHPQLIKNGDGIDRVYIINKQDDQTDNS